MWKEIIKIWSLPAILNKRSAIIKLFVIVSILVLIYLQLTSGDGQNSLKSIWLNHRKELKPVYLWLCLCLMPINWYLEALKFKKLMMPHIVLSVKASLLSVLGGLAIGIVTPGRVGEYAGRLITTDPEHKTEVISATLLGSIAQNICNIAAGLAFSYFFLKSTLNVTYNNTFTFVAGVTIQIVILVAVYYHLPQFAHLIEKMLPRNIISRISARLKTLDLYKPALLNLILGLSFLRYMVYFLQYILIIRFFNVGSEIIEIAGNVAGIYMIQTGIPLPAFLSIMARGELAILVWSGLEVSSTVALAATFTLWIINLILPSVAGLIVLYFADIKNYFK